MADRGEMKFDDDETMLPSKNRRKRWDDDGRQASNEKMPLRMLSS
jgi:hypothetical protein